MPANAEAGGLGAGNKGDPAKSIHSEVSLGALKRREEILAQRKRREEQRAKEEAELREEEDRLLAQADEESAVGGGPKIPGLNLAELNLKSVEEAQLRLLALDLEREKIVAMFCPDGHEKKPKACESSVRHSTSLHSSAKSSGTRSSPPIAELSVKIKPTPPKPWEGSFNHIDRDTWILSAKGYFAGVGLRLDDLISEALAPHPYSVVRGLMAPRSAVSGISPQQWFDSRNRSQPWTTTREVLKAIEAFWVDDTAKETTLSAFRSARQGSLKARQFGALVETLAVACVGRTFSDEDKKEVFLSGLHSPVRTYVDTQIRQLERRGERLDFQTIVTIAADTDSLKISATSPSTIGNSASGRTKPAIASDTAPKSSNVSAVTQGSTRPGWAAAAQTWQDAHPLADKKTWFKSDDTRRAHLDLQCYNCGKKAGHYSSACKEPRVKPDKAPVYVAGVIQLSPLLPTAPEDVESGKDSDE
jgi:hypothetical protein